MATRNSTSGLRGSSVGSKEVPAVTTNAVSTKPIADWSVVEVADWLRQSGRSQLVDAVCRDHAVTGKMLLRMERCDLREMGISGVGDRLSLIADIDELRGRMETGAQGQHERFPSVTDEDLAGPVEIPELPSSHLDPEPWKVTLSLLYVMSVFTLTAWFLMLAHERVPDSVRYPPLPDIILDNLPHIPWAFYAAEVCLFLLGNMWVTVLIFHRHRFILMRRMFSLTGTVYLLRCFTMIMTSLSIPGKHSKCIPAVHANNWERFIRAVTIWSGMGLKLNGVETCGDYMFSGHTVLMTILLFFITEYSPKHVHGIQILAWLLLAFGIFLILAAHEHYSIDVFVAFYLSSRLFHYYHWLANNRILMVNDRSRARIWFPLFSFFESKCNGVVPNEYEWPISAAQLKSWMEMVRAQFLRPRKTKTR